MGLWIFSSLRSALAATVLASTVRSFPILLAPLELVVASLLISLFPTLLHMLCQIAGPVA